MKVNIIKPAFADVLQDDFGRSFPYLRLSLTDVCNFRCDYCLPDGYQKTGNTRFLTAAEVKHLITAFRDLGMWKIRLTGGEPTLRKDFMQIARMISSHKGIEKVAITTNGYKLRQQAAQMVASGITAINVSVDTLDKDDFYRITDHDKLPQVLEGIEASLVAGIQTVKLNAVLIKGTSEKTLPLFLDYIKERDVSVRFIELMQTGDNYQYFKKKHIPATVITNYLESRGWQPIPRKAGDGPAVVYQHPQYKGRMGVIAPYSKDFCQNCNRLRVSATGQLHLCLFGEKGIDLRPYLACHSQQEALKQKIIDAMRFKKSTHFLHDEDVGIRQHLASIGG